MNRDDIIRMAREAGLIKCDCCLPFWPEEDQVNWEIFFERFATIVAAAEREACAKACDANGHPNPTQIDQAKICAAAIRARGQS